MSKDIVVKLIEDLNECRKNASREFLDWDWDAIAVQFMGNSYNPAVPSVFIDRLMGGYYGFKKYDYDRQLCELLEKFASKGDPEAVNVLKFYARVQFQKGLSAQSLGRLKEASAARMIAEELYNAVSKGPHLVTYLDRDGITLSEYAMMIEAIKNIGIIDDYIGWALGKCVEKSPDALIKRDAEEALKLLSKI